MMKYERLTERKNNSTGIYVTNWKGEKVWKDAYDLAEEHLGSIDDVFDRLAELEDDLESGKIIRLPCKVGDTVWVITECYNSIKGKNNYFINKRKVEAIEFNERCFLLLCNDGGHYILGRRTFLTREEAEKKLKELQE